MTNYQVECLIDYDLTQDREEAEKILDTLMDELGDEFSACVGTAGKGDPRLHILMTVGDVDLFLATTMARLMLVHALREAGLKKPVLAFEVIEEGEWDKREEARYAD